ncbi:MAG: ATP-dependent DNA helicase RecG [Paludibacteraceae bacterium]|nr:ATP-dependent DNA helicase RecG [Paludibacteraceae bacterium]
MTQHSTHQLELSEQNITYLTGVGPKRAEMLKKELHVNTALDLLYIFPYKYIDRSRFYKLREIEDSETYVQIIGEFLDWQTIGIGKKQRLSARFTDGNDIIEVVWFKGVQYLKLQKGVKYILFGKPSYFNHQYNIVHPELELLSKVNLETRQGLEPHYNTSGEMKAGWLNSKAMRKIIEGIMPDLKKGIPDTLPLSLREQYHLMDLTQSLVNIHFPKDVASLKKARERLKFEELFYIQLQILRQMKRRELQYAGFRMPRVGKAFNDFYFNHLPFQLTNAQKRVVKEIQADMRSGKQMNRLLQGDVGSGKTLVALLCALLAKDNGFQTCIMAPTEILANQHMETLSQLLQGTQTTVALLTGSTTKKQREALHSALQAGQTDILIGTHALIEDSVQFCNLGLVIVDEQHRFGVAQRAKLWTKNVNPPHVLVMTATPIPRTLAMTVYGDLSVSIIDELPPGRKPIQTLHYTQLRRDSINRFLREQIQKGRQIYVVYPLIEESKKSDLVDLENGFNYMREHFPDCRVSMVHGKMKPKEKDLHMQAFARGETQILVATTVIEVGVNVPNASVMVVENAERFGLSQLHQLRGRVGRGAEQSYCILLTRVELSKDTRKRMDIMVATNDGFRIAEADLQLRGPGDLEGTQQSGLPFELKIASLSTDGQLLEVARKAALDILEEDPNLETEKNRMYAAQLSRLKQRVVDWGVIS